MSPNQILCHVSSGRRREANKKANKDTSPPTMQSSGTIAVSAADASCTMFCSCHFFFPLPPKSFCLPCLYQANWTGDLIKGGHTDGQSAECCCSFDASMCFGDMSAAWAQLFKFDSPKPATPTPSVPFDTQCVHGQLKKGKDKKKSSPGPVETLSEPFREVNSKHPLQPGRVWTGETQILLRLLFPVETRRTTCQTVAANSSEIFWPRQFSLFFPFLLCLCLSKTFESEMISSRKRIITSTQTDALMTDYLAMAASSLYVAAVPTEEALRSLSADAAKMAANVWIFTPSKITADKSSCVSSEGSFPWLLQRLDQPTAQDRQPHGTFTFLAMH